MVTSQAELEAENLRERDRRARNIVKALAVTGVADSNGYCGLCGGIEHEDDCPWQMAHEWCAFAFARPKLKADAIDQYIDADT